MQEINYTCVQVWCLEAFSRDVPSDMHLREPRLLTHTHLYSEKTDISFSKGPYRLFSVCCRLLPPQLQFAVLLVGLIKQVVDNPNTSINCLNINTTPWLVDIE